MTVAQKREIPVMSKADSWKMFDDISARYDFLNQLLSFGMHSRWRRSLRNFFPRETGGLRILDVATGTAGVLIPLCRNNPAVRLACGIDMADKMLEIGRRKIKKSKLESVIELRHGDAHRLPFSDQTFDVVTIAFGIRNMKDPARVLREIHRVLRRGGRVLVLEFSQPSLGPIRWAHHAYLQAVVPLAGRLIAGNKQAYRYLSRTIEGFPYGEKFCLFLRKAGFTDLKVHEMFWGTASIYHGNKG